MTDIASHFNNLLHLMELEAQAEEEQLRAAQQKALEAGLDPEKTGMALRDLVVVDESVGLAGRVLLTLRKRNRTLALPYHQLGPGTPVLVTEETGNRQTGATWRGLVSQRNRETIQVALEILPETENDRPIFRLDASGDDTARSRAREALQKAAQARSRRLADLRDVLLGIQPPVLASPEAFEPFDPTLDESQIRAVGLCLAAPDVGIIHGPPGTGKTTTVVEVIRQAVVRGETVLACAPSNLAVDNILERLLAAGIHAVRLGHPARVMPILRENTLDELVQNHPDYALSRKFHREAQALHARADRFTRAKPAPGEKRHMREEAAALVDEARQLENSLVERILDQAQVICATLTGLSRQVLGERTFDLCVLDEAAQSTEPAAWIPICRSRRLVLAGDHKQLPPTVLSMQAAQRGFGVSLMERLMDSLPPNIACQLNVQYRMHNDIMQFSSEMFYHHSLLAHPSVVAHLLQDLPGVSSSELTSTPVHFVDTAGASYDEEEEENSESRLNPMEASLVVRKVQALIDSGLAAEFIGVITPYSAQVRLLREQLPEGVEIHSVDGFQGREKEAIIISLVRSNTEGEIGFLGDERRMNVALTRARRKLVVIGDSATIGAHAFYQSFLAYIERINAYHSVWEES